MENRVVLRRMAGFIELVTDAPPREEDGCKTVGAGGKTLRMGPLLALLLLLVPWGGGGGGPVSCGANGGGGG